MKVGLFGDAAVKEPPGDPSNNGASSVDAQVNGVGRPADEQAAINIRKTAEAHGSDRRLGQTEPRAGLGHIARDFEQGNGAGGGPGSAQSPGGQGGGGHGIE